MNKRVIICSQCIALAKDSYSVTESTRRQKVTCGICGKRRYGAECILEKKIRSA